MSTLPPVSAGRRQSTLNKIWLGLSGLLLGGAMGAIVYLFVQDARSEA